MSAHKDMNGIWTGAYTYVYSGDTVSFTAWFDDQSGAITGSTLEPNTIVQFGPAELASDLTGSRTGNALTFSKVYTPTSGIEQPPVRYSGTINSDFTYVEGIWFFDQYADYTGKFTLHRSAGALEEMVRRRALATMDKET